MRGPALREVLTQAMATTGALFALLIAATTLTLVLRMLGTDRLVADWVTALGGTVKFADGRVREISLAGTPVSDAQLAYLSAAGQVEKLNLETTETGDMPLVYVSPVRIDVISTE